MVLDSESKNTTCVSTSNITTLTGMTAKLLDFLPRNQKSDTCAHYLKVCTVSFVFSSTPYTINYSYCKKADISIPLLIFCCHPTNSAEAHVLRKKSCRRKADASLRDCDTQRDGKWFRILVHTSLFALF